MKRNLLSILAISAALFSCQKNEIYEPSSSSVDLHATIEDQTFTKTYMDENNNIRWSEEDQVVAFMKTSLGLRYQIKKEYIGKTSGYFSQVSSGSSSDIGAGTEWDHNVVYYPYSDAVEAEKSGDNYALNVVLPSEQTYAAESFGNGAMAMVAVSESNNITFRNVLGGMKLQLKGIQKVATITLLGRNNEKLSGSAVVTAYAGDETKPSIAMSDGASTLVTLDCGSGVQLNESTATEFIIALPPVLFSKGFIVKVADTEGNEHTFGTDKPNEVKRSSLLVMPEVTGDVIQPQPDNEIWYTATSQATPKSLSGIVSHEYNENTGRGVIRCDAAITKIPADFFSNQPNVTSVSIPQSVTNIKSGAFAGCSLTSFTIPENVTRVESRALSCETLKLVTVNASKFNYFAGDAFLGCYNLERFSGPLASSDGRFLISSNTLLSVAHAGQSKIEIPENVTTVAQNACVSARSVSEIIIPDSVTSIETSAFGSCSGLKKVTIESDCVQFQEIPFNGCSALEEFCGPLASADGNCLIKDDKLISTATYGQTVLCIPEGVRQITFFSVSGSTLKYVFFPASIQRIVTPAFDLPSGVTLQFMSATPSYLDYYAGENLFYTDIRPDLKIYVPAASLNAYKNADGWVNYADYIFPKADYVDEYGVNHGQGVMIDGVIWAPVNCGYKAATADNKGFPYGKLYQWGRKYGQGYSGKLYDNNGNEIGEISDAEVPAIEEGGVSVVTGNQMSHSNIFYTSFYKGDWVELQDDELWNSGTESNPIKTEYDPCPDGWRVPTYAELDDLSNNYSSWTTDEKGQSGRWFSGTNSYTEASPQVFLPAAGNRHGSDGNVGPRGRWGDYWSSMPSANTYAGRLEFSKDVAKLHSPGRANGSSVRCVQVTD